MNKIQILTFTAQFVSILGRIISYAIIVRILLSWFSMGKRPTHNGFTAILNDVTDPFINICRKIPHKIGMMDFAPLIAMIGVDIATSLLVKLIFALA